MARTVTLEKATGTLTVTGNFTANDEVTVGDVTYKFVASPSAANDVDIGGDAETSLDNLTAAINGTGTEGTTYGDDTEQVPAVIASNTATVLTLTARLGGTWGNAVVLDDTTDGGGTFSISREMSGGSGDLHTYIEGVLTETQVNAELIADLRHALDAAAGA